MAILDDQYTIDESLSDQSIKVSASMKENWMSTSKWAYFLAILGLIGVGIGLVICLAIAMIPGLMNGMAAMAFTGSVGIIALMFFVGILGASLAIHWFHLRFASKIQRAIQFDDQDAFQQAWLNFRNHVMTMGITIIATVALYFVFIGYVASQVGNMRGMHY
jgi:sterol desaturase/sphingolipid hydroxylase (fatty acid hydroxylase superfamily)